MSLIISHGDGDGVCAAAIAFKAKPSKIVFAHTPSLPRLLGKILLQINQIKELIIIDIAVDERQVDRLLMNSNRLETKILMSHLLIIILVVKPCFKTFGISGFCR